MAEYLCYGGFARLATKLDEIRATGPTILLDAGDQFVGTTFSYFYKGPEASTFQNYLKTDVMTLGNHEFDYGPNVTAAYLKNLTFPVATCNVRPKASSPLFGVIKPGPVTLTLALPGGATVKVGVVGWTTTETFTTSSPGPDVEFLPLVSSVQACVSELQAAGVNIIIGLGHAGFQSDGDLLVAKEVPGIDVIVGGHSHTFFYNGNGPVLDTAKPATAFDVPAPGLVYPYPAPQSFPGGSTVPYLQVYFGARYLGNVALTFSDSGDLLTIAGAPILLGGKNSSNPVAGKQEVKDLVSVFSAPLDVYKATVIGSSAVRLDGERTITRTKESNLGDLITDALLWEVGRNPLLEKQYGAIKIAVTNGGGIRTPIAAGNITIAQVIEVLPFGNVLTIKKISGAGLLKILAFSADKWTSVESGAQFGGFLQVSGIYYAFDPTQPAGSRLLDAKLLDPSTHCLTTINPSDFYNVVTNDFTGKGGDGYADLGAAETVFASGRVLADIVNDYVGAYSPVAAAVQGRIRVFTSGKPRNYKATSVCKKTENCFLSTSTYKCNPTYPPCHYATCPSNSRCFNDKRYPKGYRCHCNQYYRPGKYNTVGVPVVCNYFPPKSRKAKN
eukprot:jgi/Mesen1/8391/ME000468S07823